MMGGLCFNDWLIQEGYLVLKEPVREITPIAKADIDWNRTVAWGDGGYYGRCFLNIKGREPKGIVEPAQYETLRNEMIAKLEALPGPDGQPMGTKVHKPQDVYPEVRGVAPDLIVYFGDLDCHKPEPTISAEPGKVGKVGKVGENRCLAPRTECGTGTRLTSTAVAFARAVTPGSTVTAARTVPAASAAGHWTTSPASHCTAGTG